MTETFATLRKNEVRMAKKQRKAKQEISEDNSFQDLDDNGDEESILPTPKQSPIRANSGSKEKEM